MQKRNRKPVDVYGHLLWAFFQGEGNVEIVENDVGDIGVGNVGPQIYFSEYKHWTPIEKKAMQYVNGRALDIGCGVGRHSLYLQKKGLDVTGMDASPLAIKVCKLRGLKKAKVLPIEQIHRFKPNSFDSVLMMGNNFGLFGSFQKARSLLRKLEVITSSEARIIAETTDPYQTDDLLHLQYQRRNRKRGRMGGQLRFRIRYRNLKGKWMDYLIVSKSELQKILANTGWKVRRFIDSGGPQYIMVLEKHKRALAKALH
ncbi:MAG: class I SAM-dependent methyltransferase [Acidobacteria bacterium]|nr:class I SAM-dependent methyltransferase [Acidobacteriota bacterium]